MAANNATPHRISRRNFLRIVAASGLSVGLGATLLTNTNQNETGFRLSETRILMGTPVNLTLVSTNNPVNPAIITATFAEMERWVALFDHRNPQSALARLNREGTLPQPPPEMQHVFRKAQHYAELSGGAFDVTIKPLLDAQQRGESITPQLRRLVDYRQIRLRHDAISFSRPGVQVTLDGIAKGAVIDAGVAALQGQGYANVLLEAGGDLMAAGHKSGPADWQIAIQHPRTTSRLLTGPIALHNQAAATSGDYQHHFSADFARHHILDPRSGNSPPTLAGVTVLAPTALDADALSTTVMVLGPGAGLALIERLPGIEGLLITKDLQHRFSTGFPDIRL